MVSAADPRAAAAGVEMLKAGGSATDAAIATMLALNVVEPQSSGLGGGSFWVRHAARTGQIDTIDARETAPHAATPRWFYTADGTPLSHADAVPGGRSPSPRFNNAVRSFGGDLTPQGSATFTPGADGLIRNPAQAALLERIAKLGPDSFYVGPQAQKLVATVNGAARNPSQMTTGDIASYEAKPRPNLCVPYRTYKICGMGPPSSGGITVLMILKQLERFDMGKLGPASPVAWHLFAESSRLAYADRNIALR
ncbi:hypothetical protein WR25_11661 [Diploscapter pachys]|uniref:Gamma-glutamyltransferase n=1 Tax=Diploscapter pachys TaxID=2018661 RepID=A0A2A2K8E3_9BILA|nr:hypothetical protein WR25_11661 [Diploscapter pachys]